MNKAEKWEAMCERDPHRNNFVIPKLKKWLRRKPSQRMVYLGSGTGYIIRSLIGGEHLEACAVVDNDPDKVRLCKALMPASNDVRCICGDVFDLPADIGTFDTVLICNLILEIAVTSEFVKLISKLLTPNGFVLLFVPDTLVDFLKSSPNQEAIRDFLLTASSQQKTDKVTKEEYPFVMQRLLYVISRFCEKNFSVVWAERSDELDGYCFLAFQKGEVGYGT